MFTFLRGLLARSVRVELSAKISFDLIIQAEGSSRGDCCRL